MLKDEKVKRVIEQCRRRVVKIIGKPVSVVICGYTKDENLTFEEISKAVCGALNISFTRITRKCRKRELVIARHLIFYYARQYTKLPHREIAEKLGYNDHTSGVNAVRKVRGFIKAKDDLIITSMKTINKILNIAA